MRRLLMVMTVMATVMLAVVPLAAAKGAAGNNFVAQLGGDAEVPPVDTPAHGTAHFHVAADGTVHYKVVVNQTLAPVVAAHIHAAPAGSNGPVVQNLFNAVDSKVTNKTTIFWGSFEASPELLDLMASGGAYVNVHTVAVPSGEVRGQIG